MSRNSRPRDYARKPNTKPKNKQRVFDKFTREVELKERRLKKIIPKTERKLAVLSLYRPFIFSPDSEVGDVLSKVTDTLGEVAMLRRVIYVPTINILSSEMLRKISKNSPDALVGINKALIPFVDERQYTSPISARLGSVEAVPKIDEDGQCKYTSVLVEVDGNSAVQFNRDRRDALDYLGIDSAGYSPRPFKALIGLAEGGSDQLNETVGHIEASGILQGLPVTIGQPKLREEHRLPSR